VPGRPTLRPRAVRLAWPGADRPITAGLVGGAGRAEASVVLPDGAIGARARLEASVEVELQANAYAGRYAGTIIVTMEGGP
jgi:hypothetical protein